MHCYQLDGIKREGIWEVLGKEGVFFINGISALIKENPQNSPTTTTMENTAKSPQFMNQEMSPHQILNLLTP